MLIGAGLIRILTNGRYPNLHRSICTLWMIFAGNMPENLESFMTGLQESKFLNAERCMDPLMEICVTLGAINTLDIKTMNTG